MWKSVLLVKTTNEFAALENLNDDNVDINRTWESIRENMKVPATESLSCYKMKQHKPWFHEEFSKILGYRKQVKLH